MGVFYLTSVLSVGFLPKSQVPPHARDTHVFADVFDGLRYVRGHERLGTLMLLYTLVVIVGFPHVTILPGFVENQLGRSSHDSSILFGVSAFGSTLASLAVAARADSPRAPRLLVQLALAFGVVVDRRLAGAGVRQHGASSCWWSASSAAGSRRSAGAVIVRQTEPRYVGRVMSLTMLSFAGFGLMGLPIGVLADAFGERVALAVLGVVVLRRGHAGCAAADKYLRSSLPGFPG